MNPYVAPGTWLDKSSVDYNFRAGLGGSLWRNRFTYRVYAGFSVQDNRLFWATLLERSGAAGEYETFASTFIPQLGRQTVTSFNGEIEYRPISSLRFDLGVHGRFYNKECDWANGEASFVGNIGVDYTGRKISFGIEARMESERSWSTLDYMFVDEARYLPVFKAPFTVDLRAHFDWRVSLSRTGGQLHGGRQGQLLTLRAGELPCRNENRPKDLSFRLRSTNLRNFC